MPQYVYFLTTKCFVDLSNDSFKALHKIKVFDSLITELESFIDFYFEGIRFTLHWDLDQWILTNYDENITKNIFDELCIYLESNL